MSLFQSKAIVLKKKKQTEREFIYTLFSYDFGKIDAVKKISSKEKPLDIGYDINFEIRPSKNLGISKISNIKILNEFDTKNQDYSTINAYLLLLSAIYHKTEKFIPIYEVYNLIHELSKKNISKEKILISHLKLLDIFGELSLDNTDPILQKILLFIHNNTPKNVVRLSGIHINDIKKLQIIVN